jgi:pilus assembly protein TadC
MRLVTVLVVLLALAVEPAHAYIGPGLGLGAIGAFLGALFAGLLAILGFFWYPIKRLRRRRRERREASAAGTEKTDRS